MADPVGTPTFLQMFSPTKSPFHALSLFALACLLAIYTKPLADYGTGFVLIILAGSFGVAPLFRPRYNDRVYGLSLMFGRSVGLIGAMVAMAVLLGGAVPAGDPDVSKLPSDSLMFNLLWWGIIAQAGYMALLFCCKTESRSIESNRYNIVQFCLMQSTLLIFTVLVAIASPSSVTKVAMAINIGGFAWFDAALQPFNGAHIAPQSVAFALMLLWCASAALNMKLISETVAPGWVEDHGDGTSD